MKDEQLPTIDIGALAGVTGGCGGGNPNLPPQHHHHHHHGNGGGGGGTGGVDIGVTYGGPNGDNGTVQVRQPGRYHPV